jgi:hypothetical protein
MADEKVLAFFEKWNRENLARTTPFERHLHEIGRFDDVIRPEITADDVISEALDHCAHGGCEHCIGYWKHNGRVSYCTHECHENFKASEVPYNHCSYLGHANCPGTVRQGINVSYCTCPHHLLVQ